MITFALNDDSHFADRLVGWRPLGGGRRMGEEDTLSVLAQILNYRLELHICLDVPANSTPNSTQLKG